MSREVRHIEIMFTVNKPEHLPRRDGQRMYADDVSQELRAVIQTALDTWYEERGHELLCYEPFVIRTGATAPAAGQYSRQSDGFRSPSRALVSEFRVGQHGGHEQA